HWFASDRQHIHHRLVALGLTPRQALAMLYFFSGLAAIGCILVGRTHNIITATVVFSFVGVVVVVVLLLYPEYFQLVRGWTPAGVRARLEASDAIDSLLAAHTWQELSSRLPAAVPLLEIDFLRIDFLAQRFEWQGTDGSNQASLEASLRQLIVPLHPSGYVLIGRDLRRKSVHWPIEAVGRDLAMVVSSLVLRAGGQRAGAAKGVARTRSP
ncbi:MAG: hypothetical protein ACE5G6_05650, partial [Terriglobia bacterium]